MYIPIAWQLPRMQVFKKAHLPDLLNNFFFLHNAQEILKVYQRWLLSVRCCLARACKK